MSKKGYSRLDLESSKEDLDEGERNQDKENARWNEKFEEHSEWDNSNLVSKFWLWPSMSLFLANLRGGIALKDLIWVPKEDRSRETGRKLEQIYDEMKLDEDKSELRLLKALIKTHRFNFISVLAIWILQQCIITPFQYVALAWIIGDSGNYYNLILASQSNQTNLNQTIPEEISAELQQAKTSILIDLLILTATFWLTCALFGTLTLSSRRLGMRSRIGASYLIYRKSLRLSRTTLSKADLGQLVNLLSNDVNRFDSFCTWLLVFLLAPIQLFIAVCLLIIIYVGLYVTLATLACLVVLSVLTQSLLGKMFVKIRLENALTTDSRISLVKEFVYTFKIIKMNTWERLISDRIHKMRQEELKAIKKGSLVKAFQTTLCDVANRFTSFVAILTLVSLNIAANPVTIFALNGMIAWIGAVVNKTYAQCVVGLAEGITSCKRIENFLQLPELDSTAIKDYTGINDDDKAIIKLRNFSVSWHDDEQSSSIIRDFNLEVEEGELLLVVGRTGSGKSSLILSLIGELTPSAGNIFIKGSVSYAPQEAWIFPGSVRDNILFGEHYDLVRYNQVIRVCSLSQDMGLLVDGDQTPVGERGITLSGGQRSRINLARAIYRQSDIYILDDPFSSMDTIIMRQIFKETLLGFLKGKTVILTTNQLQFAQFASRIIVLNENEPAKVLKPREFLSTEEAKAVIISQSKVEDSKFHQERPNVYEVSIRESPSKDRASSVRSISRKRSEEHHTHRDSIDLNELQIGMENADNNLANQSVSVYSYYLGLAFTPLQLTLFAIFAIICQGIALSSDFFISFWTDSAQRKFRQGSSFQPQTFVDELTTNQIVTIYATLVSLICIASYTLTNVTVLGSFRASKKMHQRLIRGLANAPMSFFDYRPLGIIVNRATRDMGYVDQHLPQVCLSMLSSILVILGVLFSVIVINRDNLPYTILAIFLSYGVRFFCQKSVIRLRYIEGVTRSPVFSHQAITLTGISVIRAFKSQGKFAKKFHQFQNLHSSASFSMVIANCLMGGFVLLITSISITLVIWTIYLVSLDYTSASTIGLLVSQLISLPHAMQWVLMMLSEFESLMTCGMRIKEYTEIEPEKSTDSVLFQEYSFQSGSIIFENVSLRYWDASEPVLDSLSFHIKSGEKIGIVGRTGAGKSSIIAALFRLYQYEGSILIDTIETSLLSLENLRRSISIIPQEPLLLAGSLRQCLDPMDIHTDDELWTALESVQLRQLFQDSSLGLNFQLQESGSNLSAGQRQLVCLAMATLKQNKILVLDEATASVDFETDLLIQRTIAQQFSKCTIITIAHRLVTIVGSDRVLVLEHGHVKEFDEPCKLIDDKSSQLNRMIDGLDKQQADELRNLFRVAHRVTDAN